MPRRARVALIAAAVLFVPLRAGGAMPDGFVGAYLWEMDNPRFGGISGLDLSDDGLAFTAITDRGDYLTGRLARDAGGAVTGVVTDGPVALRGKDAPRLASGRRDAEGLAIIGTRACMSFEGADRVLCYDPISGDATNLPDNPAFAALPKNGALEALAVDAKGALYTMPEEWDGEASPVWRYDGTAWDVPFTLPRDPDFLPVGADFGPDGRLYVLERGFSLLGGFASRVRSFAVGDALTDARLEMQSPSGTHDNLESVAVWRDGTGAIRLTMVSDDNFLSLQETQLVDYRPVDSTAAQD